MFKSLKSKILTAALTAALTLPSLVFGASVSITLKDHRGTDLSSFDGINVVVEDGFGAVMYEGTPTANPILVDDLAPYNNYLISVVSTKTIDGKNVKSVSKRNLSFTSENEAILKNIYIPNTKAENVLFRIVGMPTDWTTADLELEGINTSTVRHLSGPIVQTIPVTNGTFEAVAPEIIAGTYKWRISGTGQTFNSKSNIYIRDNATIYINPNAINDNAISINFNLKNADRTDATFSGERIEVTVKNDRNEIVMTGDATPMNGSTVNLTSNPLPQGSYTMVATMTKDGVTKTYNRNIYVGNSTRTVNINPIKITFSDITFLIKDSRTGAPINAGTYTIKNRSDMSVLSTGSFSGGQLVKSLANGRAVVIEVEATGYSKRTSNINPTESVTRDITMNASL